MVSSKAKISFEPPPNYSGSTADAGHGIVRHLAGRAILCASRRLEQEQHGSQEREQTMSKGSRVAWAKTVSLFTAVEVGTQDSWDLLVTQND